MSAEREGFRQAFFDTLAHKGEGLLTRYLYHDPSSESEETERQKISATLHKHFGRFLYGASAWDANASNNKFYRQSSGDMGALDYAIERHIVSRLPEKMHLIEYGAGGKAGAVKPAKLIRAIMKEKPPGSIGAYTAIDKVPRFASEAAQAISDEFNIHSSAVVWDFMASEKPDVPRIPDKEDYTPVVVLFGNIMANAPDSSMSGGKDAKQNVATYFSQMARLAPGTRIVMTFHAENDPVKLLEEYQDTKEMRAFVLTDYPRAIIENLITNEGYDPFQHWRIQPIYDERTKAMKSCAVCVDDHIIPTVEGDLKMHKGDSFTNAAAYQWDEIDDYPPIFEAANCEIEVAYRQPGSTSGVILARVRAPSL